MERGAPAAALPWLCSCTRTSCQLVNSEPPSTCLCRDTQRNGERAGPSGTKARRQWGGNIDIRRSRRPASPARVAT